MLPLSIIHEILLRLPIISIARFRFICKSWYEIISDPHFQNIYLQNHSYTSVLVQRHDQLYLREIGRDGGIMTSTPFIPNEFVFLKNVGLRLVGSYNGLFCIVGTQLDADTPKCYAYGWEDKQTVWIGNPLTGECMVLPEFPAIDPLNFELGSPDIFYGFGSCIDNDHYKVIRIASTFYYSAQDVKILTLGIDDKWRDIDDSLFPPYQFNLYNTTGVAFNGFLYWVLHDSTILAFDIGNETTHQIQLPPLGDSYHLGADLVVWDGYLCFIDNIIGVQTDIWTMNQYGVVESWTKDITVRMDSITGFDYPLFPITTMRNGNLLMSYKYPRFISVDPKTKNCIEIEDFGGVEGTSEGYIPKFCSLDAIFKRNQ